MTATIQNTTTAVQNKKRGFKKKHAYIRKHWGPMFHGCRPKAVEQPSSWS